MELSDILYLILLKSNFLSNFAHDKNNPKVIIIEVEFISIMSKIGIAG